MSSEFAAVRSPKTGAELLQLLGARPLPHGDWELEVDADWWGWSSPHGGVLAAVAASAAAAVDRAACVATLDARFVAPAGAEPLRVTATVAGRGRSLSTVDAVLRHGEVDVVTASATLAVLGGAAPELARQEPVMPSVAAPLDCPGFELPRELVPIGCHFEIRPANDVRPLTGAPATEMQAWIRLRPQLAFDAAVAIVLCDALPPGLYPPLRAPIAVPTVQLGIHLTPDLTLSDPDGFVLVVQRLVWSAAGWCCDETELWDAGGRLLGQARQLRRVLGAPRRAGI